MDDADLPQARMEAEEALRARGKPPAPPKVRYSHCVERGEVIYKPTDSTTALTALGQLSAGCGGASHG